MGNTQRLIGDMAYDINLLDNPPPKKIRSNGNICTKQIVFNCQPRMAENYAAINGEGKCKDFLPVFNNSEDVG